MPSITGRSAKIVRRDGVLKVSKLGDTEFHVSELPTLEQVMDYVGRDGFTLDTVPDYDSVQPNGSMVTFIRHEQTDSERLLSAIRGDGEPIAEPEPDNGDMLRDMAKRWGKM